MGKDARSHVKPSVSKPPVSPASRTTSKSVAAKAGRVLASSDATPDERSVAASALAQADGPARSKDVSVAPDPVLDRIENELESMRVQLAERDIRIADLTSQLADANQRADAAQRTADEQAEWAKRQKA